MPKAVKEDLFYRVVNLASFYRSYRHVMKGKWSRPFALKFHMRKEEHIHNLLMRVLDNSYMPGIMKSFIIREPKMRWIETPMLIDRVLYRSIYDVIQPYLEPIYVRGCAASVRGKGIHFTAKLAHEFLTKQKTNDVWILKLDIKNYFASIDHSILKKILKKRFKDRKLTDLLGIIIDGFGEYGKGIAIGTLPSQPFANIYLNELDQYVVHTLKYSQYIRYMDDIMIFVPSREAGLELYKKIEVFLKEKLKLKLNPKSKIVKFNKCVYFCGYRIFFDGFRPRKRNFTKMKKRIRDMNRFFEEGKISIDFIAARLFSFAGYVKICINKQSYFETVFRKSILFRENMLSKTARIYWKLQEILS